MNFIKYIMVITLLLYLFSSAGGCSPIGSPAKKIIMNVDYFDHVYFTDSLYVQSKIDTLLKRCAESGVTTILWRVSIVGKVAYHSKVRTIFDGEERERANKMLDILAMFDPLEVACNYAHKYGLRIYPWVTIYDDYWPDLQSQFSEDNPQYQWVSRDQKKVFKGVLCYAYPEVRNHRLAQIKELLDYNIDGIYLCTRSHAFSGINPRDYYRGDVYGYNTPIVEAYQRKYGINILTDEFDFEKWNNIKGIFLTQFLTEASNLIHQEGKKLMVGIMSNPYTMMNISPLIHIHLDYSRWIKEGIVDELLIAAGQDIVDFDSDWLRKTQSRFRKQMHRKGRLYIWLRVWDWSGKFPKQEKPDIRTKPLKVVAETVRRVFEADFDGIAFHESLNIEQLNLWTAITGKTKD